VRQSTSRGARHCRREDSTTEFGWNGGIGLSFNVGSTDSQLYLEAKYHSVETTTSATYVPITVGYRW